MVVPQGILGQTEKPGDRWSPVSVRRAVITRNIDGTAQEHKQVLFNPTTFSFSVVANYSTLTAPGRPVQSLHYINTENIKVPLQLFYDEFMADEQHATQPSTPDPRRDLDLVQNRTKSEGVLSRSSKFDSIYDFKKFLLSLVYPDKRTFQPPTMTFAWPGFVLLRGIIRSVNFSFSSFTSQGRPLRVMASLDYEVVVVIESATTQRMRTEGLQA